MWDLLKSAKTQRRLDVAEEVTLEPGSAIPALTQIGISDEDLLRSPNRHSSANITYIDVDELSSRTPRWVQVQLPYPKMEEAVGSEVDPNVVASSGGSPAVANLLMPQIRAQI